MIKIKTLTANCTFLLFVISLIFAPYAKAVDLFSQMTIKDEYELGQKYNAIMKTQAPIVYDPFVQNYLQDMVDNILLHAPTQPFEYEINLMLDPTINAFASPGGYIYVNSGLFLAMDTESELAGVVGHEIAHVTQRHIADRHGKSTGTMLATLAAALAAAVVGSAVDSDGDAVSAAITGGLASMQSAMLSFSRQDETEADNVGFELVTKAGYDPYSYVNAFKKLQAESRFVTYTTYLSSHPDLSARIAGIEGRLRAQKTEKKNLDNTRFQEVKTFIQAKYDKINTAKVALAKADKNDAFTHFAWALLYEREHKINEAQAAFDKALKLEPNNPLFLREAGYFQFQYKSLTEAHKLVQKSSKLQPRDLMTTFYLGRIYEALGQYTNAIKEYNDILRHYPLDSQVHKHLSISYGALGDNFDAYKHLTYSNLYRANFKQADKYFNQVQRMPLTENERKEIQKLEKDIDYYKVILLNG